MITRLRRSFADDSGFTLVAVTVSMMILGLFAVGAWAAANQDLPSGRQDLERGQQGIDEGVEQPQVVVHGSTQSAINGPGHASTTGGHTRATGSSCLGRRNSLH